MYLHCLIPQKLGVLQRYFYLLQFEKERNHFALPFFFCSKATRFFFGFFWLPPGSERQQNLQANESDCECFMGLCDRFGEENHKSLVFLGVAPHRMPVTPGSLHFSRGFLYKPSFTTPMLLGGTHTQLIFQTKKSFNKKSVSWLMIPYTPPKFNHRSCRNDHIWSRRRHPFPWGIILGPVDSPFGLATGGGVTQLTT